MVKLQLQNITKTYKSGETVTALQGISLGFRESEFVAILGPSGCGKTTLLNIIGGLDRYDQGDLIINGASTKTYKASDWDAYRNHSIGFVFQNYNLIGHQTVLQNVEIALTISGVSAAERKRRAKKALTEVGLKDQIKKKPNQLSGGQMQRVAIARALVNNPDIILADEPTGSLDSHTSIQVMEILKDIAQSRLVIMVTHNGELAQDYASRIINLFDGEIKSDSNPPDQQDTQPQERVSHKADSKASAKAASKAASKASAKASQPRSKKTSMSFITAAGLSFKNLITKRGRTIITSLAGSIGIIGVSLVLALSSGLGAYMSNMQTQMLSGFPLTISTQQQSYDVGGNNPFANNNSTSQEYPTDDNIISYNSSDNSQQHTNVLTSDYLTYLGNMQNSLPGDVNTISYQYGVQMNVLAKTPSSTVKLDTGGGRGGVAAMLTGGSSWQEMPDNPDFILSLYDLVGQGSRLPTAKNEIALVVDKYNHIDSGILTQLGLDNASYKATDLIGLNVLKVIDNNDYYTQDGNLYDPALPSQYQDLYDKDGGVPLTIVGILRIKPDAASSFFSPGFVYTNALTQYVLQTSHDSDIAQAQLNSDTNVLTGAAFTDDASKTAQLRALGEDTTPTGVSIYPTDFSSKDQIKTYLDTYNEGKSTTDQVIYSDMAQTISSATTTLLNTISLVLIAFAAISLVVSTIMIGIITYVSVMERTKEIGILRSIGARKRDISRVFTTEAMIIGLTAGLIGIGLSYLLSIPINALVSNLTGITGIASLNPLYAVILVVGSIVLTLIAGLFPARVAANKDPVEALRTE